MELTPIGARRPVAAVLQEAVARHRLGDVAQARQLYQEILRAEPHHAQALQLLGFAQLQCGQPQAAVETLRESLRQDPSLASAQVNLAAALRQLNRPDEALMSLDAALRLVPDFPEALNDRGTVLCELGRPEEAVSDFRRALSSRPGFAQAANNLANALIRLGRCEEALAAYDQALRVAPGYAPAHYNRANLLLERQRYQEALEGYRRVSRLDPGDLDAQVNAAVAALRLGRREEGYAALTSVTRAGPRSATLLSNLGNALIELQRPEEAIAPLNQALQVDPQHVDALNNLGHVQLRLQRPVQAAASFERLLELSPRYDYALGHLIRSRMDACDWAQLPALLARAAAAVGAGDRAVVPQTFLALSDVPALQLQCARTYGAHRYPPIPTGSSPAARPHDRLRIAYLSGDLREHAVAYSLMGVLEQHDRTRFEVSAVSFRPAGTSPFERRVAAACEHFVDVSHQSDEQVAQRLREREIDIAVDLMGYTDGLRLGILQRRAAPVQVTFLGYPGSLGTSFIDYLIADSEVIPEAERQHFAEAIVRLPHCYLPVDDQRAIAAAPDRSLIGLPPDEFIYCAFTNAYKITPLMFERWMRCLRAVPGSVLWLRAMGADAQENLRREAERQHIDPLRLVFAPPVAESADHLARYRCADLYLDTLPYNAHSTACEALWAGLPLITCRGDSFPGRVAASVLVALGLPELVTQSLEEYERLAVRLAQDPGALAALRAKLAAQRATRPLFDTARYCRDLERAYTLMWQRHVGGEPPAAITVPAAA